MTPSQERAVYTIHEADGKRIRRLSLAEPYLKSAEVYLTIQLEDGNEILMEIGCCPHFRIAHLGRDTHGELIPLGRSVRGSIRRLTKGRA